MSKVQIQIFNKRIEVFNRLKLLDSVGNKNKNEPIGPLRQGYIKNLNTSINPIPKESKEYE